MFRLILLLATASLSFGQLRISQVYGGGGNAGSTLKNDFIEVFNRGNDGCATHPDTAWKQRGNSR